MLSVASVAPVVAPRLIREAQGTLREHARARHLALARQGQRTWVSVEKMVLRTSRYAGLTLAALLQLCASP